ncbi:glycoside hydrolase family 2 protein [Paenibacillus endoradicis]|uniref:glycoside hydrolase family 2 protein n=1 Tax=Paenibacillus endoradicis TaxID=2972487 RepID=UPI002159337C|nr:sugar-binding domain-containing protein [Paenibacillus endoradicis]MCR8655729.1 glycoside hydrolase family 2 [Paenibacillus endoradicis]MCR8658055.1 glycoside hydrolase family 2 [Paenibacillus endoradicis]
MTTYRMEYPRPQYVREVWVNLNGEWSFEFDDENRGSKEHWELGGQKFTREIQVPFAYQSQLSGIADPDFHDIVWYSRSLEIPKDFTNKRIMLHFGAVDYEATVWVNGHQVAYHEGGHTPFHADITDVLQDKDNVVVVKVIDFSHDVTLPRGKQYWLSDSASIFYTRTTGIWQTVWMEAVSEVHLSKVKFTPHIDSNEIEMDFFVDRIAAWSQLELQVDISFNGEAIVSDTFQLKQQQSKRRIGLHDFNDHGLGRWWSPENPNLYDVAFTLMLGGKVVDQTTSYFGMRKVSVDNGLLCINNRPYQMKLVLDQGYFPDGNLTPPSDDAIKRDIELTKEMGFNGARKHQKIEDPRYLYWCDRMGLLVWGEAANAYQYSNEYVRKFTKEWQEAMDRDYNHPSLVVWVPLNESWGVPNIKIDALQQQHAMSMYYLTKSLDSTRPVISNDGWEMVETDLYNIHDYEWREEVLRARYATVDSTITARPANRDLSVGGHTYRNQPILVTEFGGISYKKSEWEGWGYSGASNDEDFIQRLEAVIKPMQDSKVVQGYCYTQLTDVEQEINGLLTYDRQPKVPLEMIRAINESK